MKILLTFALIFVFGILFSTVLLAQTPTRSQNYVVSGMSFYQKGELDTALQQINKAIALDPKNVDAYFLRAAIKNKKGVFTESLVDYDKIIELDPQNPRIEIVYTNRS